MKPHLSRDWLFAFPSDPDEFSQQVLEVCDFFASANECFQLGSHIVSCDELTAIHALERKSPTLPMKPGLIERREFEYVRHGTLSLIANFEVATGEILPSSIGPTRNEADFATHIHQTIAGEKQAEWIFMVD